MPEQTHRPVRSFVRREGRMTKAQLRALRELWPLYGIEKTTQPINARQLFGRKAPIIMEIGFGNGDALLELAAKTPQCDFLGVEVYRPGIGRLLIGVKQSGLTNVRVFCDDAQEVMRERVPEQSLAKLLIFFPDPWPKKRHHKRRLIQAEFARLAVERLEVGGTLHIATDWRDYAEHMLAVLDDEPALSNAVGVGHYASRPAYRPQTKFERRGAALGHQVWDLLFERTD